MNKYFLMSKTGDAEFRALTQLNNDVKQCFLPIIELTRGRKVRKEDSWPIKNRLEKIYEIFKGNDICIDLTSSERLSNTEIESLYSFENGYESWIDFTKEIKRDGSFNKLIPCILSNFGDPHFEDNYRIQIETLTSLYSTIAYRNSLRDDGFYDDLVLIKPYINDNNRLLFILDCEYISSGGWKSFSEKTIARIKNVTEIMEGKVNFIEFVICATSFPNNISEIGKDDRDEFRLNEIDLFNEVKSHFLHEMLTISYGDYGSINPIRNDDVVMARGWIPRIDVATENLIYYVRERKKKSEYSLTYTKVAKAVTNDQRFLGIADCWGKQQIKSCAEGAAPGSTPSFWISVRMNTHIHQQIRRLKIL